MAEERKGLRESCIAGGCIYQRRSDSLYCNYHHTELFSRTALAADRREGEQAVSPLIIQTGADNGQVISQPQPIDPLAVYGITWIDHHGLKHTWPSEEHKGMTIHAPREGEQAAGTPDEVKKAADEWAAKYPLVVTGETAACMRSALSLGYVEGVFSIARRGEQAAPGRDELREATSLLLGLIPLVREGSSTVIISDDVADAIDVVCRAALTALPSPPRDETERFRRCGIPSIPDCGEYACCGEENGHEGPHIFRLLAAAPASVKDARPTVRKAALSEIPGSMLNDGITEMEVEVQDAPRTLRELAEKLRDEWRVKAVDLMGDATEYGEGRISARLQCADELNAALTPAARPAGE